MFKREWEKSASFLESCRHALDGVVVILKTERNLRILVIAFGLAVLLALWLQLSPIALAVIVVVSASILAAEMFNAALEAIEDLVWPEYREAIKISKDMAAGAVLVLSVAAVLVGLLLFLPPILDILG